MAAAPLAASLASGDPTAQRLIGFLRARGADARPHAGGRTLLDHLVETYAIARRWGQPLWLAHAGLLHSVYGTDAYDHRVLTVEDREHVRSLGGDRAERLAFLFSVTPRGPLLAGVHRWARDAVSRPPDDPPATPEELDALVVLHMVNLAEQAGAGDGGPVAWLVRLCDLSELIADADDVALPPFVAELAALSDEAEADALGAYRAGLAETEDPQARGARLAFAAAACPPVGEPCLWLADLAHRAGDGVAARRWARLGTERLHGLGTAWDKRLDFEEWLRVGARLGTSGGAGVAGRVSSGPRALAAAVEPAAAPSARPQAAGEPPTAPAAGLSRFHRYMRLLGDGDPRAIQGVYPDLESSPWFDPEEIPLARHLRANFTAIRHELLALEPERFQPESERIGRTGDWDVIFLYERGRRRDDVCDACPVTAGAIEEHGAMRTPGGLIYVSRMRGGTHIQPHRGPTNLRVRCHLGLSVPAGDCAIRVGDQARRWAAGECLVFDDHFEHEAWNHTAEDRIVLIVDLWHPGLSADEVRLLQGLQGYAYAQARRLTRYWATNAAAAAGAGR